MHTQPKQAEARHAGTWNGTGALLGSGGARGGVAFWIPRPRPYFSPATGCQPSCRGGVGWTRTLNAAVASHRNPEELGRGRSDPPPKSHMWSLTGELEKSTDLASSPGPATDYCFICMQCR